MSLANPSVFDGKEAFLFYTEQWLQANIADTVTNYFKDFVRSSIKYRKFTCFFCFHQKYVYADSLAFPCEECKGTKFYVSDILSNNSAIFRGSYILECATCLEPIDQRKTMMECQVCGATNRQYSLLHGVGDDAF